MDPVTQTTPFSSVQPTNFERVTVGRNKPLPAMTPDERAQVKRLEFLWCAVPEDFSPQDYPNLEWLEFDFLGLDPSNFNRELDLRGLQHLEFIKLGSCRSFNSPILFGNNPRLRGIDIARCGSYWQPLELYDLPALEGVGITFQRWDRGPFVPPVTIGANDTQPVRATLNDDSGALSEDLDGLVDGAVTIRMKGCPNLNRFVFQGYIRESDIALDPDKGVVITGWTHLPLEVKKSIIFDSQPNLAEDPSPEMNQPLVEAIKNQMGLYGNADDTFLLDDNRV